jgi:glycosyltransferase involved in cell wall biosynthesis
MAAKHILIIHFNDYPNYEGLGVRIENIARVYVNNGHKVTIFAPNFAARRAKEEILNGCKIIRINVPILKGLLRYRMLSRAYSMIVQTISATFIYFKYLRTEGVEIIQAEEQYSIPPALVVKAFTGASIFVDDITTISNTLISEGHPVISKMFTLLEKVLFRMCDEFIYTSDVCRNYCMERRGKATVFLPNGVNCKRFTPGEKERKEEKVIFFNSSTYSYQNIQAIKNFLFIGRLLKKQVAAPFKFHLISSPVQYMPSGLMDEIQNEREWFYFEKEVSDIASRIQEADIVLLPYSPGHHITGGVRLKALEYMACGKVVVSTPEGVEGINGLFPGRHAIITASLEDMVPVLVDALKDQGRFDPVAENARVFVKENYDWDKITRPMLLRLDNYSAKN